MAFVQTGPRRSTRTTAAAARGHEPIATASSPPTLATDIQNRDADWSIVFPGRVGIDSTTAPNTRANNEASPTTLARATSSAATLAPLHDGTGSFGDASINTAASSHVDVFDSALFLDDDDEPHADDRHSGLYFENDDDAESSATPPSLDTSGGGRGRSSSFSRTRNYSHSSSSAAFSSPPLLHDDFASANSATGPQWSWQQEGTSRVLASTTPTQHSSTILDRTNRPVFFDSDSEGEEQQSHPAYRRQGKAPQPSSSPSASQDDYEADLASAPFAISAGLRPRPRRARVLQNSTATSEISGSQASAGFKRRHRRQHLVDEDTGSVRSSKSRRSESYCGSAVAASRQKGKGAAPSSSRLSSSSASSRPRNAVQVAPVAGTEAQNRSLSKRQRATRLLARLFDVDNDVLDSVLEDQGPLALSAQEQSQARRHHRSHHAGFDHEREQQQQSAPAGWRELIDGRIVEDVDGEQEEASQTSEQAAHNPILELAKADWSGVELPGMTLSRDDDDDVHHLSSPTLQEAIRHALTQLRGSTASTNGGAPSASSAILSSTVEAIQGAMPYFVPFSWRLLMRVMKEWNGSASGGEGAAGLGDQDLGKGKAAEALPQQQRRRQVSAASTSLTHNEVASLEDSTSVKSSSDKVEEWREKSGESLVSSVSTMTTAASASRGRGRARERRALVDGNGEDSTWSLATAATSAGGA